MSINNKKEPESGFSCPAIGRRLTPEELKMITQNNKKKGESENGQSHRRENDQQRRSGKS